jgi:hypothetical protein
VRHDATSCPGVTRDEQIDAGRAKMREAFVQLLDVAARRGADHEQLGRIQWLFFDGNQEINEALRLS